MSFDIIDRRETGSGKDQSSGSRQKFLKRNKRAIKDAIEGVIGSSEGITDIVGGSKNKKKKFNIKGIEEPSFEHGEGGEQEHVISGNDRYSVGDMIEKPGGGGGRGRKPGDSGEGDDDFVFYLDRKEFLDLLFEDLELPDLVKQSLLNMNNTERVPDGYVTQGPPSQLAVIQTFKRSIGRRIGLNRKPLKEELARLQEELLKVVAGITMADSFSDEAKALTTRSEEISREIAKIEKKLKRIPFLDPLDLQYRHADEVPKPTMSAVMINIMDVSGSMTEHHKNCAKLFFFLLYLFLQKQYEKVAIVWIRHTSEAKEVDEKEFFYGRETGGTLVEPAIDLASKVIDERFPLAQWNVYVAQASDGDSFGSDADASYERIITHLLPKVQYMVYIQIDEDYGELVNKHGVSAAGHEPSNDLWQSYKRLTETGKFAMQCVGNRRDIYPVFRKLFEKKA